MASFINLYDLGGEPAKAPHRAPTRHRVMSMLLASMIGALAAGGTVAASRLGTTPSPTTTVETTTAPHPGGQPAGSGGLISSPAASPSPIALPSPLPTPPDPATARNIRLYGAGKVIVVSLAQERLVALADGVLVRESLVATGRPSLGGTPVGVFHIQARFSPYRMISPWPKGSPYYYPPSTMNYALQFREDGYFLHDAPWRHAFGPGSDTEALGTHGCVNLPETAAAWVYSWAQVGTTVVVVAGAA